MTSPKDAAATLSEVTETRTFIRLLTRRGGLGELLAVLAAAGLGALVDPRRLDYSGLRIGIGIAFTIQVTVMLVQSMQHRRGLGGDIGVPTVVTAGAVFVLTVVGFQTLHGDAREFVIGGLLGAGVLTLAAVYRSAPLLLAAGVLACSVPALLGPPQLVVSLVAMAAWVGGVVLVLHKQLKEQLIP
jgi:hypothetical protein